MSNYFKNIIFYKMLRLTHPYFHFIKIYYYPFSDTFKIIWYLVVVYFLVYICTCFLVMYIYKYIYIYIYIYAIYSTYFNWCRHFDMVSFLLFKRFCSLYAAISNFSFKRSRQRFVCGLYETHFLTISHLTFG